jgi:hypothetical protein
MQKRIWLFTVPLALLSLSGGTAIGRGGTKVGAADGFDATVTVDPFSGEFTGWGALGTVRSEPLTGFTPLNKWIGCWIDTIPGAAMLTCEAVTAAGDDLRCSSDDPTMIATVATMNSDSMVTFKTPSLTSPGVGECTHITVENISKYNVKSP